MTTASSPEHVTEFVTGVRRGRKLRLLGALSLAAAISAGVATMAFSITGSLDPTLGGSGSATTGSVTLTNTASTVCNYTNPPIVPGTTMTPCSFQVTYSDVGSASAYVGLDVLIVTHAGSQAGAVPLYVPGSATPPGPGLSFTIKDNDTSPNSYTVPTTQLSPSVCTSNGAGDLGEPGGSVCYQALNELSAWGTSNEVFANSDSVTWTVTPTFTSANGNAYQGATASLTLTAEAVQQAANTIDCSGGVTIGQTCTPTGSFAWS